MRSGTSIRGAFHGSRPPNRGNLAAHLRSSLPTGMEDRDETSPHHPVGPGGLRRMEEAVAGAKSVDEGQDNPRRDGTTCSVAAGRKRRAVCLTRSPATSGSSLLERRTDPGAFTTRAGVAPRQVAEAVVVELPSRSQTTRMIVVALARSVRDVHQQLPPTGSRPDTQRDNEVAGTAWDELAPAMTRSPPLATFKHSNASYKKATIFRRVRPVIVSRSCQRERLCADGPRMP
jgi:hypothetical protein